MKPILGAMALVLLQSLPVVAQSSRTSHVQPLQVASITPAERVTPSSIVTISFDRPVVASLEGAPSPAKFIRLSPDIEVAYVWRDPATIRILPREPLKSGTTYRITVDTSFIAMDGSRLDRAFEQSITVVMPEGELLSPGLDGRLRSRIPVNGMVRIMVDASVDTVNQRPLVRLDIEQSSDCSQASIAYRLSTRQPTSRDERDIRVFSRLGHIDTLSRVMEFAPLRPIPDGCNGVLHVPVFTEDGMQQAKHQVTTTPRFDHFDEQCLLLAGCARRDTVTLKFSAPVSRAQLIANVHLHPAPLFNKDSARREGNTWKIPARLGYRTRIRVDVDTAFRDVYGRRFMGAMTVYGEVADATPSLLYATGGVITAGTRTPTITVRHINADSIELRAYQIMPAEVPTHISWRISWDSARYRKSGVRIVHPVRAPFNGYGVTELRLPQGLAGDPGTVWTVSAYVHTQQQAPDSLRRADDFGNGEAVLAVFEPVTGSVAAPTLTMQFTNLAVHARLGGSTHAAWITDTRSGASVPNATVRLLARELTPYASAITARNGVAVIDSASSVVAGPFRRDARPGFIEIVAGTDRLVTPLVAGVGSMLAPGVMHSPRVSEHSIPAARIRATVWGDRPIYRPGDKMYLGMFVRGTTAFVTNDFATKDSVRFRVDTHEGELRFGSTRSQKEPVSRSQLLSAQGFAADSLMVPPDAGTGDYWLHAEIKQGNEWKRVATTFVEVAEYRIPEFLVASDTVSGSSGVGDTADITFRSTYLHGAPVIGADVRMKVKVYHGVNPRLIKGLPRGFSVGRTLERRRADLPVYELRDTTDDEGVVHARIRVHDDSSGDVRSLGVVATVTDDSRAQITKSEFRPLHFTSSYLGMSAASQVVTGDTLVISLIGLSLNGQAIGGRRFSLTMLRLRYERTEEFVREDDKRFNYDTVYSASHLTTDSILNLRIPIHSAGFMIVEASSQDEEGRPVVSNLGVNVFERPAMTASLDRALKVHVSDSLAAIGDTVTISFDSPFERAEAWITAERDGVISSERRAVRRGRTSMKVPVTAREAPMMYYGITLVPQGVAWANTSRVSERTLQGYAAVYVDMRHKKLAVTVTTDRTGYMSGDTIVVRVRARGSLGQPVAGAATIWAVDEANLALGDYSRPSPFALLHSPFYPLTSSYTSAIFALDRNGMMRDARGRLHGIGVAAQTGWTIPTTLSLSASTVIEEHMQSLPVTSVPAMMNFDQAQLRSDFRTTAFFVSHVLLDSMGEGEITRELPSNLTRYRVFAIVADSTSRVGIGETTFAVSRPLLIRAVLPRFVRAGDSLMAGGAVSTTDNVARQTIVNMTVDSEQIDAERRRSVLAATKPVEVRFPVIVPDRDTMAIELRAQSHDASDGVLTTLPVLPVMRPRVIAVSGTVRGAQQVRIALPATTDIEQSQLTLRIGNTPLALLHFAGKEAMRYPFECAEQLASNIRVLSALLALQRNGRDAQIDSTAMILEIERLVALLQARVTGSGEVHYWPGDVWTAPWLIGYTALALLDARGAGFTVDKHTIERMIGRLRLSLGNRDSTYGSRAERALAAQRSGHHRLVFAMVSRRNGLPVLQQERLLFDQRVQLTWEDRAWLAELLHTGGMSAEARTVLDELWSEVPAAGAMVDVPTTASVALFPSTVRAPARLLSATLLVRRDHPSLGALAERVMSRGRALGGFWNTQDYGWMVPALSAWTHSLPAVASMITVSGTGTPTFALTANALSTKDTTIGIASYSRRVGDSIIVTLSLKNEHADAYFAATISEVSSLRAVTPDRRGLTVERWIERYADGLPVTDVGEGELVRVRLRIRAEYQREFVALEDWLPAGLEVIDPSLRTSASLAALTDYDAEEAARETQHHMDDESGTAASRWSWFGPWEYRELRDDKVRWFARQLTPGTHTVSYIARATTAGKFVRPPAHAEEMYNPGVNGRSDGGWFGVRSR